VIPLDVTENSNRRFRRWRRFSGKDQIGEKPDDLEIGPPLEEILRKEKDSADGAVKKEDRRKKKRPGRPGRYNGIEISDKKLNKKETYRKFLSFMEMMNFKNIF
jgi:hypothetical protein